MIIEARLKENVPHKSYYVGCKKLTHDYQQVDVTDSELALIKESDIAEIKSEEKKPIQAKRRGKVDG